MVISILCANDSMELVFPTGTSEQIMEKEKRKLKEKLATVWPDNLVYVHIRQVPMYDSIGDK